jgi:hypothetical protein
MPSLKLKGKQYMRPKRYIVWSKKEIDLTDSWQKKWYIQQVLNHGRAEDISQMDWDEIRSLIGELNLSPDVRRLWENYFSAQG